MLTTLVGFPNTLFLEAKGIGGNAKNSSIEISPYVDIKQFEKDPVVAIGLNLLFPLGGHIYAEDWQRGLKFMVMPLLLGVGLQNDKVAKFIDQVFGDKFLPALMINHIVYIVDTYDTVNDYNKKLRKNRLKENKFLKKYQIDNSISEKNLLLGVVESHYLPKIVR